MAGMATAFVALAGCTSGGGGGGSGGESANNSSNNMTNNSGGGQTGTSLSVETCMNQQILPGVSVRTSLSRDSVRYEFDRAPGFPNGRRLQDPVIDLTLAYLFVDLSRHDLDSVAKLAVNPPANDKPFLPNFPYVAAAWDQVVPEGTGSGFAFRTNPVSDYVNVDAMGNPAVATVLVSQNIQPTYNDNFPADYASNGGKFIPDITQALTGLATLLRDDFQRLSLTPCAKPV